MVKELMQNKRIKGLLIVVGLSALMISAFFLAERLIYELLAVLVNLGVDFSGINESVFSIVAAVVQYAVVLLLVIGLPWILFKKKTTLREVGLHRLPSLSELGITPIAFIVYMIASALLMAAAINVIPGFNPSEVQEVGFKNLTFQYEYIIAFITLVVLAPFVEEVLFRGYLYGKMKRRVPWIISAIVVSAIFGYIHGQWNVALDTFVLGMFACLLREISGSLWPSILLHMMKNGLAYYFIFINPLPLS